MNDFDTFKDYQKKQKAYQFALAISSWDANTEAPKDSMNYRSEMLGILSGEHFSLLTDKTYQETVNALYEDRESLSETQKREIEKAKKNLDKIVKIPKKDYIEFSKLVNKSQKVWEEAKADSDYELFKPYLEKIIAMRKKMVEYRETEDKQGYNVLLDDFEEGMTMEKYDEFFQTVKDELVPFVKKILANKTEETPAFVKKAYPKDKQKAFVEYLLEVFDFNQDRGVLKESVHPFTWNTHSKDVRFTTHYVEDYVLSSIFAAIHELGHATYEQQVDDMFDMTNLKSGASMGIHESQSRFYENMIGRSKDFWSVHLSKMKSLFPSQLKDVDLDTFYRAINRVEESFIRIEADELTYPLHILIRYEIERMIFNDEVDVDDLPKVWNEKIKQYLNLDVEKDSEGILQDVHWSTGMFGYFPTYALGSAYAAQIYYALIEDIEFYELIKENRIDKINKWLRNKIHCYGSSLKPWEILEKVTGEPFNPKYYVQYLKEKYSDLYLK
ncbi:MAG: carboxypeptidase M32 [Bacillota bacterium]